MDFLAVISMIATGFFAGSTTVAWAGHRLEQKLNAKLELKFHAMQLAAEAATEYGIDPTRMYRDLIEPYDK